MEEFILSNKERMLIFKVLCENKNINFNKIMRLTQIPSNKLSYQLNLMKDKNFVVNNESLYSLTLEAERLIPYFSQIFKKEVGVLPVILGIVRNGKKILLLQRKKMPYKRYWGLFGGKQISGETIPETIEREVLEESNLKAKFTKYNAVVYERLKEQGRFKHSFLFVVTSLKANTLTIKEQNEGKVSWFSYSDVLNNKISGLIPSDIEFLRKYADKKIDIDEVIMEEKEDNLTLQ
ncbi:MAG: NUDIX domain-containing protein [Candidatus Nanoarchaeia archaeon]|nr:NUDIX domain-containing protein [Candidatus Nanoarchaeia archaeon]MDD5740726.1 NUDIX domain-containing protein [Candidatus Nanoarchaeia archaeon]